MARPKGRTTTPSAPRGKMGVPEGRRARHKAQVAAAERSARLGGGALVMVGDSITQAWQTEGHATLLRPYRTVNLGTSGDRTEQIIWRLTNGALPERLRPLAFTLMAGTNNAGLCKDNPIHIADGVLRIIELLDAAAPDAPILLYPIFPRGHRRSSEMRRITSKANDSLLGRLPRRRRLIVRDLRNAFLDDEGNVNRRLMPDYLHLSRAGYEIWAADIKAALAR
ncbi:MAG: GDSL-type esterase/lipase family protein [Candidatus Limnocylindrus sp.]